MSSDLFGVCMLVLGLVVGGLMSNAFTEHELVKDCESMGLHRFNNVVTKCEIVKDTK